MDHAPDQDQDTVTCHLCATDLPRDVAFRCYHDRQGGVRVEANRGPGRWIGAFVCPPCAAFAARSGATTSRTRPTTRPRRADADADATTASALPLDTRPAIPWLVEELRALERRGRTELGVEELCRVWRAALVAAPPRTHWPLGAVAGVLTAYTLYHYLAHDRPWRWSSDVDGEEPARLYSVAGLMRTLEALLDCG